MFENNSAKLQPMSSTPNIGGGVVSPKRSETELVISKLQNVVQVLADQVGSIETKLEPITRLIPVGNNAEAVDAEFSTKVAQEINNSVRTLSYLAEKIMSLRDRIEL